ncbi:hypothetical protein NKJ06_20140 [Mesorhizobium sp. M0293]|uniref:inverse autotransporter beta domain-containing protein n=1 Tax=Mesorhizobium sp. M0293 TaxID=2956930 RepID=UPI0033368A81
MGTTEISRQVGGVAARGEDFHVRAGYRHSRIAKHLWKTTALTTLALGLSGMTAHGDPNGLWQPQIRAIIGADNNGGNAALEGFIPLKQTAESVLFLDVRAKHDFKDSFGQDVGLGIRRIVNPDLMIGGYAYLNVENYNSSQFTSATLGAEAITPHFDAHVNVYLPIKGDHTDHSSSSTLSMVGNQLMEQISVLDHRDYAAWGIEGEIGAQVPINLPDKHSLRLDIGGYHFEDPHGNDHSVTGAKAGFEYTIGDVFGSGTELVFAGEVRNDNRDDTQFAGSVRLNIPFNPGHGSDNGADSGPEPVYPVSEGLRKRVNERVRGDIGVRIQSQELNGGSTTRVAINAATNAAFGKFYFADGGLAGAGTQADPTTLDDAVTKAGGGGFVVALGGNGNLTTDGVTLADGQTVIGGGESVTAKLVGGGTGTFNLGGSDGTIQGTNVANPVITLGNGNTLNGITITGGGDGIFGDNVTGATLTKVTVDGAGGNGAEFTGNSTNVTASDFTAKNNGLDGLHIEGDGTYNFTGTTLLQGNLDDGLDITGKGTYTFATVNALDNNDAGITVKGTGGSITITGGKVSGNKALGDDGVSVFIDPITAHVVLDSITQTGGTSGVVLENVSGSFTVNGKTTISNTAGPAIAISDSPAAIRFGDVAISAPGGDGMSFAGANAAVVAGNIVISGLGVGQAGLDFSGSKTNFTAQSLNITGPGAAGSIGIDLASPSAGGATIIITNGGSIAGVDTGVRFGISGSLANSANAEFSFGGGSIAGITASLDARGLNQTLGHYVFGSTTFSGAQLFDVQNVIFVGATATGTGSGSSLLDLASVATADANTDADAIFVLVNRGTAIDDADGFSLGAGQTLASFGNGRTFSLGGLPVNVTGDNVTHTGAIAEAGGAATLTKSGAGDVGTLANNSSLLDFNVSGGSANGIYGNGVSNVTISGVSVSGAGLNGVLFDGTNGVTAANLSSSGNTDAGLSIQGDGTYAFNGTTMLSDNGDNGLFIVGDGTYAFQTLNASGNSGFGVNVLSTTGTFSTTDGTISGNGAAGVVLLGANIDVTLASLTQDGGGFGAMFAGVSGNFAVSGATTVSNTILGGIGIFDSTADFTFGAVDISDITAPGGIGIDVQNSGGAVAFGGPVTLTHVDSEGILAIGNAGAITFSGPVSMTDPGDGIWLEDNTGAVSFGGAVTIDQPFGNGIDVVGSNGTISFGDIDITGLCNCSTALDLSGSTSTFTAATLDVSGSSGGSSTGIDLSGTNGGSVTIGSGVITGVDTGVQLGTNGLAGTTANTTFSFGAAGGASISGVTASLDMRGLSPGSGTYAFNDTVLNGPQLFDIANVIYVGAANTGLGDGSSVNDLINATAADALAAPANTIFVLVNNGAGNIDTDADGFTLADGQSIVSFANGASVSLGSPPANVTGANVISGTQVQDDPFGNGGATLNNAAGNTIDLANGNVVENLAVGSSNRAIDGEGSDGATINGVTISAAKVGLILDGTTGIVTVDNLTIQNPSQTGIAIVGSSATLNFTGNTRITSAANVALFANDFDGTATFDDLDISGVGTGIGVEILGGSSGTLTFGVASSIADTGDQAFSINSSTPNLTYNGTIDQTSTASAVRIFGMIGGTATFGGKITATGAANAINLGGNAGGTINFAGGVAITMGVTANTAGINFVGTNGHVTFGTTTVTLGAGANQTGIDFSGSSTTADFGLTTITGTGDLTSRGIDLSSTTGNKTITFLQGSKINNVGVGVELSSGGTTATTANATFTFGDGDSTDGLESFIIAASGGYTVNTVGLDPTKGSYDFDDVLFTGSANLATALGSVTMVSQSGGFIAAGTTGNLSTGVNSISLAAADALTGAQNFVFVGTIDLGATAFTLDSGQTIAGFGNGNAVSTGTIQPANVHGNLGATGGNITGDEAVVSGTANLMQLLGDNAVRNTAFDFSGATGAAFLIDQGAVGFSNASGITIEGVTISNVAAGQTAIEVAGLNTNLSVINNNINVAGTLLDVNAGSGTISVSRGFLPNAGPAGTLTGGGINIANRTGGSVTFTDQVTIGGTGVSLTNNTGSTVTFADVDITTNGATAFSASGGGTVNVTTGTINATNAQAVALDSIVADINFASTSATFASSSGVDLQNLSGTVALGTGTLTNSGSGTSFNVGSATNASGGNATVTYGGIIASNGIGAAVSIQELTGGSVTLSGNLSDSNAAGGGNIVVAGNNSATITFSGSTKQISSGATDGVNIGWPGGVVSGIPNPNPNSTINFTNGGLDITTTTGGMGFVAFGGFGPGTLTVTGSGNKINSGGDGLLVAGTNVGAGGITFDSISAVSTINAAGVLLSGLDLAADINIGGLRDTGYTGALLAGLTGAGVVNFTGTTDLDVSYRGFDISGQLGTINIANVAGSTLTIDGGQFGIALNTEGGTINVGGNGGIASIGATTSTTAAAISTSGGNSLAFATLTYNGSINVDTGSVLSAGGGDWTHANLSGSVTSTTASMAFGFFGADGVYDISSTIAHTGGIGIAFNGTSEGTATFSGTSKTFNTGANDAIVRSAGIGTLAFTNGGLGITTGFGYGINASTTGAGRFSVSGLNNTITTTTGSALRLDGATVGTDGVNFASISVNGAGTGILLNNVSGGAVNLGTVNLQGITATGVDITGTLGAALSFSNLDIGLNSTTGVAFDLNGAAINAPITADDFDVTNPIGAGTSIGVDLRGATGGQIVRLGDTVVGGASSRITGVNTGVFLDSATNLAFTYGDGETATDQNSTIGAAIGIDASSAPTLGTYNFQDVNFAASPGLGFGVGKIYFVGASATGDGTGRDQNNLATLSTAEAAAVTSDVLVLVNDGGTITAAGSNANDTLVLATGEQVRGFGNGNINLAMTVPSTIQLANNNISIVDATADGAATLTTSAGSNAITLGASGNFIDGFILDGSPAGAARGIKDNGFGASGTIISHMTIQNFATAGVEVTPSTSTGIDNVTFSGNASDVIVNALNTTISNVSSTGATGIAFDIRNATGTTTLANLNVTTAATGTGIVFGGGTGPQGTITGTNVDVTGGAGGGITVAGGNATIGFDAASFVGVPGTSTGTAVTITGRSGGSFGFAGAVVANGTASGISVSGATAANTVSFTGAVGLGTVSTLTGTAVSINNNGTASTVSFANLGIVTNGTTGFSASGGGTVNVTTGTVSSTAAQAVNLNGVAAGINFTATSSTGGANNVGLTNVTGTVGLGTGALSGATGTSFNVSGGSATVTYAGTITQATASQRMIAIANTTGGAINFTTAVANGLNDTAGTGILIDGAAGSVTINNASLTGARGITILGDALNNATGTFTFNNVAIQTAAGAANHAFVIDGDQGLPPNNDVSAVVNLSNVDITNPGGNVVNIQGMNGGSVTFDAASTITRTNNGLGILATSNLSGTITFGGATKTLTTGGNNAVSLTNNGGTAINFTNGGLAINTTNGTGFNATSGGTVSVTGAGNSISTTTGAALNLDTVVVAAGGVNFSSTNKILAGGTSAVIMDTVTGTGTVSLGTGSLIGGTGATIRIGDGAGGVNSGGTTGFSYAGTITSGTGRAVDIQDRAAGAGNITLSGNITHNVSGQIGIVLDDNAAGTITFSGTSKSITSTTSAGVTLTDNTGVTIDFTNGGLVIDTTSGIGFNATGGGTVTVQGTGNTITSTTGTALNVANTTIGASGLTFQSISANGGTNGIVLNTTGLAAGNGGLTVTGTGVTAGSGGTIQNTVQGALFTSTKNLSLSNMNFTNANSGNGTLNNVDGPTFNSAAQAAINMSGVATAAFANLNLNGGVQVGINGQNVSNLTIANTTVTGFGDAVFEGGMRFYNLTGTSSITNSTFSFTAGAGGDNLVDIRNDAGTSLTLNIAGSTFSNTKLSANGAQGLNFEAFGSANATLNISNSNFVSLKTSGVEAFARDTSTLNVNITDGGTASNGNTFDPQGGLGRAIGLNAEDTAHLNFKILNNKKIYGNGGPVINVFGINNAVIMGRINNNADIQGGGVGSAGSPIYIHPEDASTGVVEIIGNTITKSGNDPAILAIAHGDGAGPSADNGSLDLTIRNNNITLSGTGSAGNGAVGIDVRSGTANGELSSVYLNIANNAVTLAQPADDIAFLTREGSNTSHLYFQNFAVGANNQAIATSVWNAGGNTPIGSVFSFDAGGALAYAAIPGGHNGGLVLVPTN